MPAAEGTVARHSPSCLHVDLDFDFLTTMVRPIRWFGPVPEGTMLRAWISVAAEANNRVWRIYVEPFEFRA